MSLSGRGTRKVDYGNNCNLSRRIESCATEVGHLVTRGWTLRSRRFGLAGFLLLLAAGLATPGAAQEGAATPAATGDPPAAPALPAEDELVRRYAPVMYVKRQPEPCDASGEQFLPAPVEVVFGDDEVALRQAPHLPPVSQGIEAGDLFHLDASHYIDLPGHPRTPAAGTSPISNSVKAISRR